MPSGGAREGAGRPKYHGPKKITRTQALIAKATEGGDTPLEVLVDSMRYYNELAVDAIQQLQNAENPKKQSALFKVVNQLKNSAKDYAIAAAPYIHSKLATVANTGADGGPIQVSLEVSFVAAKS